MKNLLRIIGTIGALAYGAYEFYDLFTGDDYGTKLEYNTLEVYYTDEVSEQKAIELGTYLDETNFSEGQEMSVQLDQKDQVYQFNFIVREDVVNNEGYSSLFSKIMGELKSNVFVDDELVMNLTNGSFEVLQAISYDPSMDKPYGEKIEFNGTEVYYKDVTLDQATALGDYLLAGEFADGTEKAVQLTQRDGTLLFKIIVDSTILGDPEYLAIFDDFRNEVSVNAFQGESIELHLTDEFFNTQKELK